MNDTVTVNSEITVVADLGWYLATIVEPHERKPRLRGISDDFELRWNPHPPVYLDRGMVEALQQGIADFRARVAHRDRDHG
jgi:hypothetical protein